MEAHLTAKAEDVMARFSSESYSVDLNLELDTTQTTVTTYLPGERVLVSSQDKTESEQVVRSENWQLTGTWNETIDVRPKIQKLRCCVSFPAGQNIDHDQLYRCLSYALGVNLERGDLLQLVEI
jgi:hypothetical protein